MLLANVESAEEGEAGLQTAFIVLKDCLMGHFEVLTDNFARCLAPHLIDDVMLSELVANDTFV